MRNQRFAQAAGSRTGVASDAETLPGIEVSSEAARRPGNLPPPYAGGQVARGGSLGVLGTRDILDTPFSTVNFTQKLIEDQQARTAADTLVNDSSVRLTTGANGFDDTFQIRGFQVNAGDTGFNGLYGLISSNRVAAQYIERIQLLKGPAAFMYGMPPGGSVGGSINIITKRALEVPFARITPQFISAGNYGVHIDASSRYGANNEWGVRFNGVGRNGEATIDRGNWQTGLGALSIDYRGERLRWALDAISQNDDTKNFRPQMTIQSTVPFIPRPPDARSTWYPGVQLKQRDNTIASFVEYDLTDWLTAYGGIGYRAGMNEQTFPDSRVSGFPGGIDALGNFRLINAYYDSYSSTVSGNAGLRATFDTGFIKHSANLVFTGFSQENGNAYVANTPAQSVPSNIYNPSPLPVVTGARIDPRRATEISFRSVALADTMSLFDDRLLLTGGFRQQWVKQLTYSTATGVRTGTYEGEALSPLGGIVIKPWQNVSIYANYAEGLSQGTVVGPGYSNTGAVLAPFKSDQQEVGIKVDWGTVTTTAALFQISRPAQIRTAANALAYDGEQRNQGLELSAFGEILPGLRALASATFLRPELTRPANPLERGNDAQGVPDLTVSAGLDWDTPWVPGLALNGRVIYTSGAYLTTANTLRFPDWTRVDLGVRYATTVDSRPVTLRFNVENVADSRYWLTTGTFVTVASPRTFVLSAAFDF
ncbi:TonB-dependent siderophore receptor [Enterovirga sp. DB1703]|uniref:TonB-dependent siderophore receptor n=2 Tax=Enterovirga aerilata TaxID=2730920 RepID=A0A849I9T2_9HYPH|nr:TonB-dependent siderophore receptor [Enterovirga sp. DB1703]